MKKTKIRPIVFILLGSLFFLLFFLKKSQADDLIFKHYFFGLTKITVALRLSNEIQYLAEYSQNKFALFCQTLEEAGCNENPIPFREKPDVTVIMDEAAFDNQGDLIIVIEAALPKKTNLLLILLNNHELDNFKESTKILINCLMVDKINL